MSVKRVRVDKDEWYPVITETTSDYRPEEIDVPLDLYERWKVAATEFGAVQNALREIYFAAFPR